MSKSYNFEKERLKPILSVFIDGDCDFEKFPSVFKKPLNLYFHELIPMV